MENDKFTRGTTIAIWVFLALVVGSLVCTHYKIMGGIYFVYAMVLTVVFAIVCEVAAKRKRNDERRKYQRAP